MPAWVPRAWETTFCGGLKQTQANTLVQLFGREYADDIALVVGSLDKYKEILGLVADESKYVGSMQKEFAERVKTTEAQLQLAKNAISEAAVNLGNAFLPAIVAAARALAALMQGIADLIQRFPVLSASAVTALTALMGFGALRLVWSAVRAGVIALIQPLLTLVTEAAASASRTTTERIDQEFDQRRNRLESLADAGLVSERRKVLGVTSLAIQETESKLAEARRYQAEALTLVRREYQARLEQAKRLGQDATRVDEELLQARKRILEQTETAYRSSIDKLIAEERRHLEAARQLDEQRMNFRLSAEDRMARLSEKGMNPEQVYQSRQQRILQEQARAEEALRSGNYEAARRHAERMMELAEQTAEGVKVGNRTIVSEQEALTRAQDQVRQAALLADRTYQQQGDSHCQAAAELRGEYEGLVVQLERVRGELDGLSEKLARDHRLILSADTAKVEEAARQIDDLLEKKERVVKIESPEKSPSAVRDRLSTY